MSHWIFGVLVSFIFGAIIAFINYRISYAARMRSTQLYSRISVLRQVLHVAGLVVVFFVGPLTPWDRTYMLVAAVLGMTLPMFYFTYLLMKKNDASSPAAAAGDVSVGSGDEKKEEGAE